LDCWKFFDIQHFVNFPYLPLKMLILLGAACSLWIGLISVGVVMLMETGVSAGWIVAGLLFSALMVFALVMSREIQNAIVLPESYREDSSEEFANEDDERIFTAWPRSQTSNQSVGTS
jgi:membrane protein implicated in regulation of membrane protease activity